MAQKRIYPPIKQRKYTTSYTLSPPLAARANQDTIIILTIPDEEWTTNDVPYKTMFNDTHVIKHFLLDTIIYTKPTIPHELNKEPCIEY